MVGKRRWDCRVQYLRVRGCNTVLTPFCIVTCRVHLANSRPMFHRRDKTSGVNADFCLLDVIPETTLMKSSESGYTSGSARPSNPSPQWLSEATLRKQLSGPPTWSNKIQFRLGLWIFSCLPDVILSVCPSLWSLYMVNTGLTWI
jgi:hypothetical protein